MAGKKELTIVVKAKDFATAVLSKVGSTLKGISSIGSGLGGIFRTAFGIFSSVIQAPIRLVKSLLSSIFNLKTLMAGLFAGAIVRSFAKFEAGINQVATLVDTTQINMRDMAQGVQALGLESGQSFETLNKALFDAISAGVDAGEAVEFLGTASRLAAGGATSIDSATRGLIAIMNAYSLEAKDATAISDALFAGMKKGVTTIEAMSTNLGKVSGLARAAGITYDELSASIATITKVTALSTEEASTALRAFIVDVLNPARENLAAAKAFGIQLGATAIPRAGGLLAFLQDLQRATLGNKDALGTLFSDVRSATGALGLLGSEVGVFADIMDAVNNKAGESAQAFAKVENQLQRLIERGMRRAEVAMQDMGAAVAPIVADLIDGFGQLSDVIIRNSGRIALFVQEVRASVGLIADAFGAAAGQKGILALITDVFSGVLQAALVLARDLFVSLVPVFVQGAGLLGTVFADAFFQAIGSGARLKLFELFVSQQMGEQSGLSGALSGLLQNVLESFVGFGPQGKGAVEDVIANLKAAERQAAAVKEALSVVGDLDLDATGRKGVTSLQRQQRALEDAIAGYRSEIRKLASELGDSNALVMEKQGQFVASIATAAPQVGEAVRNAMGTILQAGLGEGAADSLLAGLGQQWEGFWQRIAAVPAKELGSGSEAVQAVQQMANPWLAQLTEAFEATAAAAFKLGGETKAVIGISARVGQQIGAEIEQLRLEQKMLRATGEERRRAFVDSQVNQALATYRQLLGTTKLDLEAIEAVLEPLRKELQITFDLKTLTTAADRVDKLGAAMESFGERSLAALSQGMADVLVDLSLGLKDAEDAWKSFVQVLISLLKQIIAILIQFGLIRAIFAPETAVLGGGGGGLALRNAGGGALGGIGFGDSTSGGGGKSGGGSTINVYVSAIDSRGVAEFFRDNRRAVQGVVLEAVNSDGTFARQVGERVRKGVL